jgi:hypothetical protein
LRETLYTTPAEKAVPVVASVVHVSAMRSVIDCGAVPVVSRNLTANAKVVAVVPLAGVAVPPLIVTVPHVRATAAPPPNPNAEMTSAPIRARPVRRHARSPCLGAVARCPNRWAMPGG